MKLEQIAAKLTDHDEGKRLELLVTSSTADLRPLASLVAYLQEKKALGSFQTKDVTVYIFPPCAYVSGRLANYHPGINVAEAMQDRMFVIFSPL